MTWDEFKQLVDELIHKAGADGSVKVIEIEAHDPIPSCVQVGVEDGELIVCE